MYSKIFKALPEIGFDEYYQAGCPNKFSKMNIVARSKKTNTQYWICIDGGYGIPDSYYIAKRQLNNYEAKSNRTYCKNQTGIVEQLEKIKDDIHVVAS